MPLSAGTRLGPYEILALIGKGGMGEVYRARDTRLGRDVAIKVSDEQFTERFAREARSIAALNHTNICHLYDVGPNYLVMELVEGETLRGPLEVKDAMPIIKQLIDGIEAAHDKNIVHRDLKPANIKITPQGVVKILDFGLAKSTGPEPGNPENSPTLTMGATQVGTILGTAAYMSPEQAKGKTADKRSDIWSFGVVVYELLVGKRPFEGDTVAETLGSVINKAPDWDRVPPAARRLLEWCFEKDRTQRLASISDARRTLEERPAMAALSPSRPGWLWPTAAAFFALAAFGVSFVHLREVPPAAPSVRFQIANPGKGAIEEFALSPDGRYLAFVVQAGNGRSLWVRALDALEARPLPGTDGAGYPFWSPDSSYIGYSAIGYSTQGKLKKIAISGGPSVSLCDVHTFRGATWGRDGVILYSETTRILRVAAAGGVPLPVIQPKGSELVMYPEFLPNGRFLYTSTGEQGGIMAGSLEGAAPLRIVPDVSHVNYVPPLATGLPGHLLFRHDVTLMALPFDSGNLRTVGEEFPVAENVGWVRDTTLAAVSASKNGVLTYGGLNGGNTRQLVWLDRSGKRISVATSPLAVCCNQAALSRDESHIAVPVMSRTGADLADIWLADPIRGTSSRFSFQGNTGNAAWSPDGSRVAFGPRIARASAIYVKPSNGGGKEELLAQAGTNLNVWDWSYDDKLLAYTYQSPTTGQDIWLLPLDGDHKPVSYLQTRFNENQPAFSPDSKWMAYQSDESGSREVWVQSIPAGRARWQISANGGASYPQWRRDGKELFYMEGQKLIAVPVKITAAGVEPGKPEVLFDGVEERFQVSADGKRFLVNAPAEGDSSAPPLTVVINWEAGLKK